MCVVFYSSFVNISAYSNFYFKTILRECLRAELPPGFPSIAPPPVRVSAVLGTLAVWVPNQKKKKMAHSFSHVWLCIFPFSRPGLNERTHLCLFPFIFQVDRVFRPAALDLCFAFSERNLYSRCRIPVITRLESAAAKGLQPRAAARHMAILRIWPWRLTWLCQKENKKTTKKIDHDVFLLSFDLVIPRK